MELVRAGQAYLKAGLNALPAHAARKCPVGSWKIYQTQPNADPDSFRRGDAVCLVGGKVSGNLEIVDFDLEGELYAPARQRLDAEFGTEWTARLTVERSPSGGYHLAYRCEEPVAGNQKLALKKVDVGKSGSATFYFQKKAYQIQPDGAIYPVGIETRGEGGICLIAPSPGYTLVQGKWTALPTITAAEREKLLDICRSFDESPAKSEPKGVDRLLAQQANATAQSVSQNLPAGASPSAADWAREQKYAPLLLTKHGWTKVYETDEYEQWRRPGKTDGVSGSLYKNSHLFKCFTSNAPPLCADTVYTPLQLMAALETGGDESEAARRIRAVMPHRNGAQTPVTGAKTSETGANSAETHPSRQRRHRKPAETKRPFPESALKCGGMIGEILDFIRSVSIKDQPVLAYAGALVAMSYCLARRVRTPGNIRPNIYCVGIAGAGTGKEAARRVCRKIHGEMSEFGASCPERYESKQALANHVLHDGAVMACPDEFARYLKAIVSRGAGNFLAALIDEWLILYSASNETRYTPRICASEARKHNERSVNQPHFCLYGTTNPDDFFDVLNWNLISNGFIPRCLLFEGEEKPRRIKRGLNDEIDYTIPPALLAKIHAWRGFRRPDMKAATKENNPPDPFSVRYTPEAEAAAGAFVRELDDADLSEKELREIYSRAAENMHKLALIHACAKYGPDEERLVIDAECVGIAIDVSRFLLAQFRDWLRKYVAENDYEASVKKVGAWFASRPRDCVTLSEFTKRWSRFKRIEREDILETLENAGAIQRETKGGVTRIWICGDEDEEFGEEEEKEGEGA